MGFAHYYSIAIKKRKGFTLVELLMVIGIMGIISTIGVVYLSRSGSGIETRQIEFSIEQALEIAKRNAFNGLLHNNTFVTGYGVLFREGTNKIIIFADCNDDKLYTRYLPNHIDPAKRNKPLNTCFHKNNDRGNEFVSEIVLDDNYFISDVSPCHQDESNCAELSIVFVSPYSIPCIGRDICGTHGIRFNRGCGETIDKEKWGPPPPVNEEDRANQSFLSDNLLCYPLPDTKKNFILDGIDQDMLESLLAKVTIQHKNGSYERTFLINKIGEVTQDESNI